MHFGHAHKIILGFILVGGVVVGAIMLADSSNKATEEQREVLETILRTSDGPDFGSLYHTTPHFDGSDSSVIHTNFTNSNLDQAQSLLQQRLEEKGYRLTCPGGKDTPTPSSQVDITEQRRKCGISGHGADGTVWFDANVTVVVVSAVISF